MDVREKLVELLKLSNACLCDLCGEDGALDRVAGVIAENLIANGVTVQEIGYVVTKTDRWATYHHHCSICDEELEWKAYPNL